MTRRILVASVAGWTIAFSSACVQVRSSEPQPETVVLVEPAMFTGFVQVEDVGGEPHVILSTATQDVVARGALVDRLSDLEGRLVRVHGRWIDTGPIPVIEVDEIDEPRAD